MFMSIVATDVKYEIVFLVKDNKSCDRSTSFVREEDIDCKLLDVPFYSWGEETITKPHHYSRKV